MIIWQIFVQLRDERGLPVAEIAPFGPRQVGVPVRFRSARPIPKGCFAVWTFNDGTMHVGSEVEHTFGKEGAYVVTLTVTNGRDVRIRDANHITIGKGKPVGSLLGVRGESVEVLVRNSCNPGKIRDSAFILDIGSRDACYFHTPCFWVQHQFSGKRRWYETNGGRNERGQFVRYMPRLRGGLWRVEETLYATHVPGSAYWARCGLGMVSIAYACRRLRGC